METLFPLKMGVVLEKGVVGQDTTQETPELARPLTPRPDPIDTWIQTLRENGPPQEIAGPSLLRTWLASSPAL
jgi:hypothetical protein